MFVVVVVYRYPLDWLHCICLQIYFLMFQKCSFPVCWTAYNQPAQGAWYEKFTLGIKNNEKFILGVKNSTQFQAYNFLHFLFTEPLQFKQMPINFKVHSEAMLHCLSMYFKVDRHLFELSWLREKKMKEIVGLKLFS